MNYFEHVDDHIRDLGDLEDHDLDNIEEKAEYSNQDRELIISRLEKYSIALREEHQSDVVTKVIGLLKSITVTSNEYILIRNTLNTCFLRNETRLSELQVDNFLEKFNEHFGRKPDNIEFITKDEMVM